MVAKQGSNSMPLTHRPDFKQALSTLQREADEDPQVPTYSISFYMVELARFMVDSLPF